MIRSKFRMRLCATFIVLNLLIIWGNSLLPGQISGAISGWVRDLIASLFGGGAGDEDTGHGLLRKLGHFLEFTCLGVWLTWLFSMVKKPAVLSLLCGFSVACVDEFIQCFVPNRGPGVLDVLLDTAGVVFGLTVLLLGNAINQKRKNNKIMEETKL